MLFEGIRLDELIIGVKPNETKGTQLLEKLAYPTMQEHL
jgi:hypothetical protein